jgi:hypothetical protein
MGHFSLSWKNSPRKEIILILGFCLPFLKRGLRETGAVDDIAGVVAAMVRDDEGFGGISLMESTSVLSMT